MDDDSAIMMDGQGWDGGSEENEPLPSSGMERGMGIDRQVQR